MMNAVKTKFEKMGADVKFFAPFAGRQNTPPKNVIRLDVRKGVFEITASDNVEVQVLDVQPKDRHLLLMARIPDENPHRPDRKAKFLCGHDERDWFVAAVPEGSASTVTTAFEALKPGAVLDAQATKKMNKKKKMKRHTEAYLRQGEWFFVPAPDFRPENFAGQDLILKNEPLRRGGGKPHIAEFCCRTGGELVWVGRGHPNGITTDVYNALPPDVRLKGMFRQMRRNAGVYVKGSIRHADHKTLFLEGWYKVEMNTESNSVAMRNVAFLD
jgi:hypothetical protein